MDQIVAYLQLEIYQSGALSVSGSIQDEQYAINALQGAIDALKARLNKKKELIIPGYDTGLSRESSH